MELAFFEISLKHGTSFRGIRTIGIFERNFSTIRWTRVSEKRFIVAEFSRDGDGEKRRRNRQERKRNVTRPSSSLLVVCYEEKEPLVYVWVARFPVGKGSSWRALRRTERTRTRRESRQITWKILMKHRPDAKQYWIFTPGEQEKQEIKGKRRRGNKRTSCYSSLQPRERSWKNFLEEFEIETLEPPLAGKMMDRLP